MSSLKENKTCALLEQYLSYLTIMKGRSYLTADEYRIDCLLFFEYVKRIRGAPREILVKRDFSDVDIVFIKIMTCTVDIIQSSR
jgi:site-specific recombinase XerD